MGTLDPTLRVLIRRHRRRRAAAVARPPSRPEPPGEKAEDDEGARVRAEDDGEPSGDGEEDGRDPHPLDEVDDVQDGDGDGDGDDEDGEGPVIDVLVAYDAPLEDLEDLGFHALVSLVHSTGGYGLAAGYAPILRLEELADAPGVRKVEGPQPVSQCLDHSLGETRADRLHEAEPPLLGRGVVVGVVDDGLDLRHGNFRDRDRKTRVLAMWEQGANPDYFEMVDPPDGYPVEWGAEFDRWHIDDALEIDERFAPLVPVLGDGAHGTHVTGIAAGNGRQRDRCRRGRYPGVAPEAELLIVALRPGSAALTSIKILYGVDWILGHRHVKGRPVVVNLSYGFHLGPHDGTSLFEQMLDELVRQAPVACAVVVAAGNDGNAALHARGVARRQEGDGDEQDKVDEEDEDGGGDGGGGDDDDDDGKGGVPPGGSIDLLVEIPADVVPRLRQRLELWYPGEHRLVVGVRAPGEDDMLGPVAPGGADDWEVGSGRHRVEVDLCSEEPDPFNGDRAIHLEIAPVAGDGTPPRGIWRVRLHNPDDEGAEVPFDCWLTRTSDDNERTARFRNRVTEFGTITVPGTAHEVITVGSYAHPALPEHLNPGQIAATSSRGPTRDWRTKPDLAAPGDAITSARPRDPRKACFDWCLRFHRPMGGTSMATPHVAGVAAQVLERNPGLDHREVREHLVRGARAPDGYGDEDLPSLIWGYGRLDAVRTISRVPPPDDDDEDGDGDGEDDGGNGGNGDVDVEGRDAPDDRRRDDPAATSLVALHRQAAAAGPRGVRWAALFSRHFSEVRGLIGSHRRIALCWHRMGGPDALRTLAARAAGREADDGRVLDDDAHAWLRRFLDLLDAHGSPGLRADVACHREALLDIDAAGLATLLDDRRGRAA